jgi:hypothetical protein
MPVKYSIIIPARNWYTYIYSTVKSERNQGFTDFELQSVMKTLKMDHLSTRAPAKLLKGKKLK